MNCYCVNLLSNTSSFNLKQRYSVQSKHIAMHSALNDKKIGWLLATLLLTNSVYKIGFWLILSFSTIFSKAIAAEIPNFTLQSDRWEQLVVPANTTNLTIREMFGDDLPAEDYASTWIIYYFNAESGVYVNPGIDGSLREGTGFWIIQITEASATLDLPDNADYATSSAITGCFSDDCAAVDIYAGASQPTYNKIGSALTTTVSANQIRLKTNGASYRCQNGCSINEAIEYGYLTGPLWHYVSSSNQYVNLAEVGEIRPWQGFWLETQAGLANSSAQLLFPTLSTFPDTAAEDAARLLTQATFGTNTESINSVLRLGIAGWIDDQFTRMGDSHLGYGQTYYPRGRSLSGPRQNKWLLDAIDGEDQLRLRVAFALSEIFVTSDRPENLSKSQYGMANYYDILREGAFSNYRDLLERVTLSPIMGVYLSMLQNSRGSAESNTRADENFAREVMQLFSIGLHELNLDGTTVNDASGIPIPAYTQTNIEEYARVFTGWDWNNVDSWGRVPLDGNANKIDPMTPFPGYHDEGRKVLLGGVVSPAGISAEEDLDNALDSLFNHPNVGPFIGKQLIQRLVTSNPTPAYVARVASVFNNDGTGERGNLQAVIRAILLDPEARNGHQTLPNYGKLREPLLRWTHLWRAFDVQRGTESESYEYNQGSPYIAGASEVMGQSVLSAPSVFNFFHPDYAPLGEIRDAGIVAPEAEIYTQAYFLTSTRKISRLTQVYNSASSDNFRTRSYINISEETQMAVSSDALLDHLDLVLLSGQMTTGLRQLLLEHFENFGSDEAGRTRRVLDAINLIMASPEYLVQK